MENQDKKYYLVKLKKFPVSEIDYTKPFADMDSNNTIQVYGEETKNCLVEILTGKKILFGSLIEGTLPGISKSEIPITEVSMYLKFLTEDAKRKELQKINQCLESVSEEIRRQEHDFQTASEIFKEEFIQRRK